MCRVYDLRVAEIITVRNDSGHKENWADPRLDKNFCQSEGCTSNADCGPGSACFGTSCELFCDSDSDCSAYELCNENACETGCRNDEACEVLGVAGLICRGVMGETTGICSPGCREDGDCAVGERCNADDECEADVD